MRLLMEKLFGEEAKVKSLAPQWEQRMWEWCSITSRLAVSLTARLPLTSLIFSFVIPEVQTMNKNLKPKFFFNAN